MTTIKKTEGTGNSEFEPWQQAYAYHGTPLDGIVKIYDYLFKSAIRKQTHILLV